MSEEKLKNLIQKYPECESIFKDILSWFLENPDKKDFMLSELDLDLRHNEEELDYAFYILRKNKIVKQIFIILDNEGRKAGEDYDQVIDIPDSVDSITGYSVDTKKTLPVPFFKRP